MPVMDGLTLVREIRKIPAYDKLPVYGVTVDDAARTDHVTLGFTGLLLKPITKEKLQNILS